MMHNQQTTRMHTNLGKIRGKTRFFVLLVLEEQIGREIFAHIIQVLKKRVDLRTFRATSLRTNLNK